MGGGGMKIVFLRNLMQNEDISLQKIEENRNLSFFLTVCDHLVLKRNAGELENEIFFLRKV